MIKRSPINYVSLRKFYFAVLFRVLRDLDCDVQTAAGVANHFKQEGILLPNSIKKKGVKPKFVAVTEEPDHGKMMLKYFDPTSMVAHHVSQI